MVRPDDAVLLSTPGSVTQRAVIEALSGVEVAARAVLISSTGIYGAPRGRVHAGSPVGSSERARTVADTEAAFRAWAPHGVILRMGGLYRPGRGPLGPAVRRGRPLPGPGNRTLALIHYDDAATAAVAALRHPAPAGCYVVVSDPNPTREAFYREAAARHGLDAPVFTEPLPFPPASYDVAPLRLDLLPEPAHPDWRDALV